MVKVLVAHASKHGGTAEMADFIANTIRKKNHEVTCLSVDEINSDKTSLADFDAFVMGTAIYAGMWMGDMVKLMRENEEMLGRKPIWFFASGPTGEGDPETLLDGDFIPPNVRPLLDAINPNEIVLFHGKVDFKELAWAERLILRAIGTPTGDFRDMESIQSWAAKVANELVPRAEG